MTVFRRNSGFVFHDSQGFEAGGIKEDEPVRYDCMLSFLFMAGSCIIGADSTPVVDE